MNSMLDNLPSSATEGRVCSLCWKISKNVQETVQESVSHHDLELAFSIAFY